MKQKLSALVIDDEPQVSSTVADILRNGGWDVTEAHTAEQAFEKLVEQDWVLVFCDVFLGKIDGYEVLRRFTEDQPNARFVMMTGYESAAGALDALAIGAYDYLVKPFDQKEISSLADSVRKQHQLRAKPKLYQDSKSPRGYVSEIPLIGRSPAFLKSLKTVGRVAPTNLPILITGESGTGKEVVAHSIHRTSPRKNGPFVAVNCGAIPVELIESELFGHEKGAFTGADRERIGMWQEADGGTIFLDEITETSLLFQVKLLRSLQQGEIRRVGSNRNLKVDVRVIAATNRDIREEVRRGRFRQDLMYRLNAVTIQLPPLRERVTDIPLLAEYFAERMPLPSGSAPTFSPAALEMLKNYNWEGNVRELENAVLHAASLCNDVIYPEHLPETVQDYSSPVARQTGSDDSTEEKAQPQSQSEGEWLTLSALEAKYASRVLAHTNWNKQAAARMLGIDYKTLTRIIKRYEIKP